MKMQRLVILVIMFLSMTVKAQEIGLQLYSLRAQLAEDVPGTLAKVKDMGIQQVEFGSTYGLSFPEFIKLIAANNLEVVSFGAGYERLSKFPQIVADEARSYGARYIVCSWLPHADTIFTKEDADRAAVVLNHAGKVAAQNGLLLCYHPHGYEFKPYDNGTVFDYMISILDTRYVYLQMDVFWIKQAGQHPVTLLQKYASRWVSLHLKDRKRGTPDTQSGHADDTSNVVLGQGDVDIAAVMKAAKAIGIKYYFIEDESPHAEQQIPQSLRYLRSLQ